MSWLGRVSRNRGSRILLSSVLLLCVLIFFSPRLFLIPFVFFLLLSVFPLSVLLVLMYGFFCSRCLLFFAPHLFYLCPLSLFAFLLLPIPLLSFSSLSFLLLARLLLFSLSFACVLIVCLVFSLPS